MSMATDTTAHKTNEQLVALIKAHENEADNMLQLWQQNKGFIYTIAKKYYGLAEPDDLLQEGYIGLCHAVQHYKSDQNASFIHYAAFWIKQVMIRYITNCCSAVRVPEHTRSGISQYKKIYGEYLKWYGKAPTEYEMSYFLDVSMDELESIKKSASMVAVQSLDEPLSSSDDEFCLIDTVASSGNFENDLIRRLDAAEMTKSLWAAVEELPDNLPNVLKYRYKKNMSFREIGEQLGISKDNARNMEREALRKLRIPSKCESFKSYFEQYITAAPVHHVGVGTFNRTWTSAVELEVLRRF